MTIAGHQAAVFQSGSADRPHFVALWQAGKYGLEIRGTFSNSDEFLAAAATIEVVDVDT